MSQAQQIAGIREALAQDADTAPFAGQIEVRPGEPLRLEGEVGSIAARRKAVRVARRAVPSVEIEDGVRLARAIRQSDQELAAVVRAALREEPALPGVQVLEPGAHPPPLDQNWIGATARDGVIYLGGWLNDLAAKAVAEGLAWETGACRDVRNLICHEPRCNQFDDEIAQAIDTLIREHPQLAGQSIEVAVSHAQATLSGVVETAEQQETAKSLCWFVPAVREVHDRLERA